MRTYREIEARMDNALAEYKMEMARRLGPPEPQYTGAAPRTRSGLEDTSDTPETDLAWCSRCGDTFEAIDLDGLGLCCQCSDQTWDEHHQHMMMHPEEYS